MADTPRVTVPVEPTEEMLDAACNVGPDTNNGAFSHDDARAVFTAMLSAAPAPEGGAVSDALQRLRVLRDQARNGTSVSDPDEHDADELDAILSVIEPALATREEAPAEAGEAVEVWVVYGDDHDYDTMSQWLVGVYSTKEEAEAAAEADRKRYVAEGGSKDRPGYDISSTRLNLRAQPQAREDAKACYDCATDRPHRTSEACTYPAPDALRTAVEALEALAGEEGDCGEKVYVPCTWKPFREVARQALATIAALQAEQKGGA